MPAEGSGDARRAAGPLGPGTPPSGAQQVFVQAAEGFRELVKQIEPPQWASRVWGSGPSSTSSGTPAGR